MTWGTPVDTNTVTGEPTGTCAARRRVGPGHLAGLDRRRRLVGLVTFSPRAPRAWPAGLGVSPTSDGIATRGLPLETTSCTADPLARWVPAGGLVLITVAAGDRAGRAGGQLTTKPASLRAAVAAAGSGRPRSARAPAPVRC